MPRRLAFWSTIAVLAAIVVVATVSGGWAWQAARRAAAVKSVQQATSLAGFRGALEELAEVSRVAGSAADEAASAGEQVASQADALLGMVATLQWLVHGPAVTASSDAPPAAGADAPPRLPPQPRGREAAMAASPPQPAATTVDSAGR
ncbi:MAG: hypothetical protein IT204_02505 [Fimbriimonadaceae bacterium]|nr:hypothetical protein [Fimbriimonadaceae bacterium]